MKSHKLHLLIVCSLRTSYDLHIHIHSQSEVSQTSTSHCPLILDNLWSSHTYTQSYRSLTNFIFSLSVHSGHPTIVINMYTVIEKSHKLHLLIVCSFWTSYNHHNAHTVIVKSHKLHFLFVSSFWTSYKQNPTTCFSFFLCVFNSEKKKEKVNGKHLVQTRLYNYCFGHHAYGL